MSATKEDLKDFEFIISEAIRINNGFEEEGALDFLKKEYNREYGTIGMIIDTPNNGDKITLKVPRRQIYLSYSSNNRLLEITQRKVKSYKLGMLVTISEFNRDLRDALYNHLFIDKGEIDMKGCTKIINNAVKLAKRKMTSEEFYFPILAHGLGKRKVIIGPAEIIPRDEIFEYAEKHIEITVISEAKKFCDAHTFPFEHFLKVTISRRSKESRTRFSKQVANFIVGILHLFSEHYGISSELISLSFNPYPNYNGFYFSKKDMGDISYNFSSKGRILWSDEFWIKFQEDISGDLGIVLHEVIKLATEPKDDSVITDRLIDAIYIFSSALQDKDESSKLIKLATALERLVSLSSEDYNDKIALNFRKRVAILVSSYHGEFEKWYIIAQEMYKIRSTIVHGSWSLYRDIEPLYASKYSGLTSKAILSACIGFYQLGFERKNNDEILKKFYDFLQNEIKTPRNC
ncbi:hypothetical protein ABRZ24_15745 [Brenneria populi]|uniref:Apea-like HEPN domain-containing protein n=1 Tax=Brenneria populi TaxID=1505588 RepID=A0ABU6JUS8_9GAMM|nr:hypothetical protein [Brenneria populi Li et al. 2015]